MFSHARMQFHTVPAGDIGQNYDVSYQCFPILCLFGGGGGSMLLLLKGHIEGTHRGNLLSRYACL